MTVKTTQTKKTYLGNGVVTKFPITFPVQEPNQIKIALSSQGELNIIHSNYKVNKDSSGDIVSVTYPISGDPISKDASIVIYRQTQRTQDVDITNAGAFLPEVIEHQGLDKLVMMIQELQEELTRAVKAPIISNFDSETFFKKFYSDVNSSAESAKLAQEALIKIKKLLQLIPHPNAEDEGKTLTVRVRNGKPIYELAQLTLNGYAEYILPVNDSSGEVVVNLDEIGHPKMNNEFNPIINLMSSSKLSYIIKHKNKKTFTIKIYNADGTSGVKIYEFIECGNHMMCGNAQECGQKTKGSNVQILLSIPLPVN